jgi:archaellum component FlaC
MDEKFSNIDKHFAQSNERFKRIEERIKLIARNMNEIAVLKRNQIEFFAEFLGFKKIL